MMHIPASTAVAASIAVTAAMLVMAPATVQAQTEQEWDSCYGIGVSTNFQPPEIQRRLEAAGLVIEEIIERPPYPEVEYQSHRAYMFVRKPVR